MGSGARPPALPVRLAAPGGRRLRGDVAAATALLDGGARADQRGPDGWTALLAAASAAHVALVELLLARGADPNVRAPDGLPPLAAARLGDNRR